MRKTTQNHNGSNSITQVRTSFLSHVKKHGGKLSGDGIRATECKDPNSFSFDVFPLNALPFLASDFQVMTQATYYHLCIADDKGEGRGRLPPFKGTFRNCSGHSRWYLVARALDAAKLHLAARAAEKTCAPLTTRHPIIEKEGDGGCWPSPSSL